LNCKKLVGVVFPHKKYKQFVRLVVYLNGAGVACRISQISWWQYYFMPH